MSPRLKKCDLCSKEIVSFMDLLRCSSCGASRHFLCFIAREYSGDKDKFLNNMLHGDGYYTCICSRCNSTDDTPPPLMTQQPPRTWHLPPDVFDPKADHMRRRGFPQVYQTRRPGYPHVEQVPKLCYPPTDEMREPDSSQTDQMRMNEMQQLQKKTFVKYSAHHNLPHTGLLFRDNINM